jgi:hypothetical protein
MMTSKPAKYVPSQTDLVDHPEYVKAIGLISVETIDLEVRLANLFARMVGIPLRIGQAIYLTPKQEQTRMDILRNAANAALSTPPRANPKSALVRQKAEALKKVERIIARGETLIRKRHRVVHDEWTFSEKEKKVTRRLVDGRPGS